MEELNLPVPFVSQEDPQANEDAADNCGPTSIAMVLTFLGENVTPNQVFEKTGAVKGALITIDQLKQAISSYGYLSDFKTGCTIDDIIALLKQGIAPIVLVHYDNLHSREDVNYKGSHFLVIDGARSDTVFANDPDFFAQFRTDGDHHAYTMTDFLAAWSNCHLDGNPDNSLLIIYPKDKQPAQPTATPEQTAQVEAATATQAPAQPQAPSLQDKYDSIQHLYLDLADELGVDSVDSRQIMHDQMVEKIKNLKQIKIAENDAIVQLNAKVGDQNTDIQELLKQNGSLETQLKSVLSNYQTHATENTVSGDLAAKYKSLLEDKESALEQGVKIVGEKKATFFHFLRGINTMKNQYEATILELKKKLDEKKQAQIAVSTQPQITTTEEKPGLFDFLGF